MDENREVTPDHITAVARFENDMVTLMKAAPDRESQMIILGRAKQFAKEMTEKKTEQTGCFGKVCFVVFGIPAILLFMLCIGSTFLATLQKGSAGDVLLFILVILFFFSPFLYTYHQANQREKALREKLDAMVSRLESMVMH